MEGMERGDKQAEDSCGFVTENSRGIDRRRRDGINITGRRSGRSRKASLKVRESWAAEEVDANTAERAPLTDKTNLLTSPIQDDESSVSVYADEEPFLPSPTSSSPLPLKSKNDTAKIAVVAHRANRFKQSHRPDASEARARCDFTSVESINHWFPPYSGKGTFNCPFSLIQQAVDQKGRATIVREWRMLTTKQQGERWDVILAQRQQKKRQEHQHNPRQVMVGNTPVDGGSSGEHETLQSCNLKRRRTLEDDRNESEDENALDRVLTSVGREFERRERRNKKSREKTQQAQQQKVREVSCYGCLLFLLFIIIR
jgi:hypothetical protein